MPTATQTDAYARDGFARSDGPVLPPDVVAAGVEGMDAVRRGEYDTGQPPPPSPWNPGDDESVLCKIELANAASRQLQDVLAHPALGAFVGGATGAKAVQVWWVQLLVKPPAQSANFATAVGWHQDSLPVRALPPRRRLAERDGPRGLRAQQPAPRDTRRRGRRGRGGER